MSKLSISWFYTSPGDNAHRVAERVRQALWTSGLIDLWLDGTSICAPYKLSGNYEGRMLELEWTPAEWLRMRAQAAPPRLAAQMSWLLGFKPGIHYTDNTGLDVWEWVRGDNTARWMEISGNPSHRSPARLTAK